VISVRLRTNSSHVRVVSLDATRSPTASTSFTDDAVTSWSASTIFFAMRRELGVLQ